MRSCFRASVLFVVAFRTSFKAINTLTQLFIVGSKNLRTSSFKDHAASNMHQHTMVLYKKSQSSGEVSAYAPIAKALTELDARTEEAVRKKSCISLLRKTCRALYMLLGFIIISMSRQIFEMSDQFLK